MNIHNRILLLAKSSTNKNEKCNTFGTIVNGWLYNRTGKCNPYSTGILDNRFVTFNKRRRQRTGILDK